jgi:hypothetical protein
MLDEVKIIESSDSKSFPIHPQIETSSRTLSGPAGHCLSLLERAPIFHRVLARHCSAQPDIVRLPPDFVWNLNLSPTTRILGDPINIHPPPTALLSWSLYFPIEQALILKSKRPNSLSSRAFILSSCLGIEWSKDLSSLCDSPPQAHLDCWIFILYAYHSWSLAPRLLEVAPELPLCVVRLEKFVLPIFVIVSSSRLSWWLLERGKSWERFSSL